MAEKHSPSCVHRKISGIAELRKTLNKRSSNSSLEFLPSENGKEDRSKENDEGLIRSSSAGSDGGRSAVGRSSSASSLSKRLRTPTKRVNLQTSVKKTDSDARPDFGDLNWDEYNAKEDERIEKLQADVKKMDINGAAAQQEQDGEADNESSSEDDSEEEPIKAPNELMLEFIDCVMDEDYENAQKLCKMILLYEPNNAEALQYQPVIEEKLQQEAEETDEEEDDDDSTEEDSDETEGDSDSSEETSDEETDDSEGDDSTKPDSGVASASEDVLLGHR